MKLPRHLQKLFSYKFKIKPEYTWKQYILIRTDRAFSLGKLMVHSAHNSCSALLFEWQRKARTWKKSVRIREWFNSGLCQAKIVCRVKDEDALRAWIDRVQRYNPDIPFAMIPDGGAYEVEASCVIGAAIGPITEGEAVELGLKELKLY